MNKRIRKKKAKQAFPTEQEIDDLLKECRLNSQIFVPIVNKNMFGYIASKWPESIGHMVEDKFVPTLTKDEQNELLNGTWGNYEQEN